ncbi:MAG TPA: hypothetical protein VFN76_09840 [Candidatus Limnocylindria bacterium]|nr:hypothetical protein [Candidatus Limnocylindria bacterium]
MVFATWMAMWSERLGGKALSAPTTAAYYAAFASELTTEEFEAGNRVVFQTHAFNTWPAPAQIIAAAKPAPDDAADAERTWPIVVRQITGYGPGSTPASREKDLEREAGAVAVAAYKAAGGYDRLRRMTEDSYEFVRRDYLAAYPRCAERERAAKRLELAQAAVADQRVVQRTERLLTDGETTDALGVGPVHRPRGTAPSTRALPRPPARPR